VAASIVVVLFWVYYSAQLVLMGAESPISMPDAMARDAMRPRRIAKEEGKSAEIGRRTPLRPRRGWSSALAQYGDWDSLGWNQTISLFILADEKLVEALNNPKAARDLCRATSGRTAGVLRFHSSLEGLTDKGVLCSR
jgi:hypothetical protein